VGVGVGAPEPTKAPRDWRRKLPRITDLAPAIVPRKWVQGRLDQDACLSVSPAYNCEVPLSHALTFTTNLLETNLSLFAIFLHILPSNVINLAPNTRCTPHTSDSKMAAAAATTPAIDLSAPSSFNLRLGPTISKQNDEHRYRNVRYNYKPQAAQGATVTSKILPGKQPSASTLSLKDGDKEWKYKGQHKEDEDMYVLVLSGDGKKEAVLERLNSSHAVNLIQTPDDNDEESLARKHPHLTEDENDKDDADISEGNTEDATPDANNPFDFRHFLKAVEEEEEAKRKEATPQPTRSTLGTPMHSTAAPAARSAKATPAKSTTASAALKKRKTPAATATKANPKRVKAGEDPPVTKTPASSSTNKAADSAVPKVRLDRKASIHHTKAPKPPVDDYEDDGELILENSTADPKPNSNHLSAMSLAISGAFGNRGSGPISLRSAASSPGVNSPQENTQETQEGEEFEFGGGSSPAAEQYEFEFVDDDDGDEEEDNDDDEAPSASQTEQSHQPAVPSRSRRGSLAGPVVDEEDDMEAQLALAMAAEEDDEEPAAAYEDSDEDVSEEE
jgi:hypothetical protein